MIREAPSITWALVTTMPLRSMMKPEPSDWAWRSAAEAEEAEEGVGLAHRRLGGDVDHRRRDLLDHGHHRGAAGGLRGLAGGRPGEEKR